MQTSAELLTLFEASNDFWDSPRGLEIRISMIGEQFTFKIVNQAIKIYGRTYGIKWMVWFTMADERVCPICAPRHLRQYRVTWFTPKMPAHVGCRCQWELRTEKIPYKPSLKQ